LGKLANFRSETPLRHWLLGNPSFTGINTTVNFDTAGQPSQNFGAVTAAGPDRVIELGLKVSF
jgi:hypothetical protein